jgi:hypothetical protein
MGRRNTQSIRRRLVLSTSGLVKICWKAVQHITNLLIEFYKFHIRKYSQEIRWARYLARMREIRNLYKILYGNLKGRDQFEDLGIGMMITLKFKLKILTMLTWFIRFRIGDQWHNLVITVMIFRFDKARGAKNYWFLKKFSYSRRYLHSRPCSVSMKVCVNVWLIIRILIRYLPLSELYVI